MVEVRSNRKKTISMIQIVFLVVPILYSIGALFDVNAWYLYNVKGYGFYVSMIFGTLLFLLQFIKTNFKLLKDEIPFVLLIFVSGAYVLISALISEGGLRYLGVVVNTMVYTFVIKRLYIPKQIYRVAFVFSMCMLFVFALYSRNYFERQWSVDGTAVLPNSTFIAMVAIMLVVMLQTTAQYIKRQKIRPIICFVGHLLALYIVIECKSRTSFVALLMLTVIYYVIPLSLFRKRKIGYILFWTIFAISMCVIVFYVNYTELFDLNLLGRSALTRTSLYSYTLSHIAENPISCLFGHGTYAELRQIFGYPAHNNYYMTWYEIGIIGLLFTIAFMIVSINYLYKKTKVDTKQIIAYVGFVAFVLFDGFSPTGTMGVMIWGYIFLGEALKSKDLIERTSL